MNTLEHTLFCRLEESGIDRPLVPGFLRNLANTQTSRLQMNLSQVQAQLKYLGWNDIQLDYHTWQLAEAYLVSGHMG